MGDTKKRDDQMSNSEEDIDLMRDLPDGQLTDAEKDLADSE